MVDINNYKLLKYLNSGAHGVCSVYENSKDFLKQKVVIKKIGIQCSKEQLDEAEILKKCRYPFIIGMYEYFCDDSNLYIVMQFAEGGSLGEEIRRRSVQDPRKYFDESEVLHYFTQITMALHYLHSQNVIHCDLKPENILLNGSKKLAKLADFGISKIIGKSKDDGVVMGTAFYLPPEAYNRPQYTVKFDIWALGCVLYEMFELERTFQGNNSTTISIKVLKADYTKPTRVTDKYLLNIIMDCLKINQDFRPSTIQILRSPPLLASTAKIMCMVHI